MGTISSLKKKKVTGEGQGQFIAGRSPGFCTCMEAVTLASLKL
jgi:hypothetical protein